MFVRIAAVLLALAPAASSAARVRVTQTSAVKPSVIARACSSKAKLLGNFQMDESLGKVFIQKSARNDRYRVDVPHFWAPVDAYINFDFGNRSTFQFVEPLHFTRVGMSATFQLPHNFVAANQRSDKPKLEVAFGGVRGWFSIAHAD